jgi:hypothetical protein
VNVTRRQNRRRAVPAITETQELAAANTADAAYVLPDMSAAVAAITAKAKLAGLWREKVAQTDPSGEKAPRYIISERPMTEEEWIRERCGE